MYVFLWIYNMLTALSWHGHVFVVICAAAIRAEFHINDLIFYLVIFKTLLEYQLSIILGKIDQHI